MNMLWFFFVESLLQMVSATLFSNQEKDSKQFLKIILEWFPQKLMELMLDIRLVSINVI